MDLTGPAFPTVTAALTVVMFVAVVVIWPRLALNRPGRVLARAGLLLGVNVLVLITAFAVLNAQFLFFADWSDLTGSLTATSKPTALQRGGTADGAARARTGGIAAQAGATLPPLPLSRISAEGTLTYTITGPLSGLRGQVLIRLPPGYTDPQQATQRYPVLETFHGYPSGPAQWIRSMKLGAVMDQEVAAQRMAPALIVAPHIEFPAGADSECVNGAPGRPQVETWLTQDVPNWVTHTFRVRTDRASWATIGLSSGGWCAAMATMLHPAQYSAAIVMAGYFRPDFGVLDDPYPAGGPLDARYNLVRLAKKTPPPVAMWLETSHADPLSYGSSAALLKIARRPLSVDALVLQHAGHRISLWQGLLPASLNWLGAHIPGFRPGSSRTNPALTDSPRTPTVPSLLRRRSATSVPQLLRPLT